MEQVKELKAALTAAQLDQQHAKAALKDLVNRLQYADQLLEKANNDISNNKAEISALKDHLERYRTEMDNLTQQLDNTNNHIYMVRRELKHAYEQKQEPRSRETTLSLTTAEQSRVPCPRTSVQQKKRRATTQNLTCLRHRTISCQRKKTSHPSRPWSCTWDDHQRPRQAV